ncbi:MAG: hypothetical protein PUI29_01215 [Aeromonadales bacterium]|nr:hypothetical protein [Aeromonadales bacterium]
MEGTLEWYNIEGYDAKRAKAAVRELANAACGQRLMFPPELMSAEAADPELLIFERLERCHLPDAPEGGVSFKFSREAMMLVRVERRPSRNRKTINWS